MTADLSRLNATRALVTGASGFIGSRLAARLTELGCSVHSLDLRECGVPGVTSHVCDLADAEGVARVVEAAAPHRVFHLAAFKERRADVEAFRSALEVNVGGSLNLLAALQDRTDLAAVVTVGTAEEYGANPAPFREDLREAPVSAYSFSKTSMVLLFETLHRVCGLPTAVVRPTVAYGPGQAPDMFLSALIDALVSGRHFPMSVGEQTRDFLYVDDVVEALILAACTPAALGRTFNVGADEPVRLADLARRVAAMLDAEHLLGIGEVPYRPGDIMDYRADSTAAHEVLGWRPRVALDDGLAETIAAAQAAKAARG